MKINFSLLAVLLLTVSSFAQQLDFQWGPKVTYDSKINGFFDQVIGSNETTIFTYWTDGGASKKLKGEKLVAINKETLKTTKEFPIDGFKGGVLDTPAMKDWNYNGAEVFTDKIILFFSLYDKNLERLGALVLDHNLKQEGSFKVIHEALVDLKKGTGTSSVIVSNSKYSDKILILNENQGNEQNVLVKYKMFNTNLDVIDMNQFDLPFEWNLKTRYSSVPYNNYSMAEGDHIFIASNTKEQIGGTEKRPEYRYFSLFTVVDLNTAAYKSYALIEDNIEFSSSKFRIHNEKAIIEGFYKDMSVEEDKRRINGIFHLEMNVNTGTVSEVQKVAFDNAFYENFKDEDTPTSARKAKKEDKRAKNLVDLMSLEKIIVGEDRTIMLCSLLYNGETTTCDGKGNCRTTQWCTKRGIIAFTFDNSLNLLNYSVIPRKAKYAGHNVYDVNASALSNSRYVVSFGSNYSTDEIDGQGKGTKTKKKDERESTWEYAILNSDGILEKRTMIINKPNTPKEEMISIDFNSIKVIDGVPYVFSNTIQRKGGRMCLSFLTCYIVHPFAGAAFKGQLKPGKLIEK